MKILKSKISQFLACILFFSFIVLPHAEAFTCHMKEFTKKTDNEIEVDGKKYVYTSYAAATSDCEGPTEEKNKSGVPIHFIFKCKYVQPGMVTAVYQLRISRGDSCALEGKINSTDGGTQAQPSGPGPIAR